MEKWVIAKIPFDREVNKVNVRLTDLLNPTPLKTGSSTFQYSTIPLFHVRGRNSGLDKNPLFSISCTNSETLNYDV